MKDTEIRIKGLEAEIREIKECVDIIKQMILILLTANEMNTKKSEELKKAIEALNDDYK